MVIKETTQVGNPVIRGKAKTVTNVNSKLVKKVVKNLVDSMRHHELVGMAAPQIGEPLRIFVSEIRNTKLRKNRDAKDLDDLRVFINPRIVSVSAKKSKGWEGCGSVAVAGLFALVNRPKSVRVEALNERGEKFRIEAKNLLARVVQHEIDHLNGILFTDKADGKTYMSRNEYLKMRLKKG